MKSYQTEGSQPIEAYKKSESYKTPIKWYPEACYKQLEQENADTNKTLKALIISYDTLLKENVDLKQQLKAVKYLDYDTVLKIIDNALTYSIAADEIINLAIPNQKKLDREEVEKIICNFKDRIVSVEETFNNPNCEAVNYDFTIQTLVKNYVTAICNLAIKPIIKDKIIKVLNDNSTSYGYINPDKFETIADGILNKSNKEE